MDVKLNRKYFENHDLKGPIIAIAAGVLLLFAGAAVPGLAIAVIGGGWLYFSINTTTDEEYDKSVQSNIPDLRSRALQKLGVDEDEVKEIDPIVISGYRFKGASKFKKGADDKWRTNRYEAVVLYFSPREVHCYTYSFITTDSTVQEQTDVYFYRDIVTVSTSSESETVTDAKTGKRETANYESFVLRTTGGNALSVAIDAGNSDSVQRSINAMRQLLRQKKDE